MHAVHEFGIIVVSQKQVVNALYIKLTDRKETDCGLYDDVTII